MQVKLFPEEQKTIFNSEMENVINQERQKCNENISQIAKKAPAAMKDDDKILGFMGGGIVGLVIGLFMCIPMANNGSFGGAFMTWIICGIIGGCIGVAICGSMITSRNEQIAANKQEQENERKRLERKIEEINSTYQKMYENYVKNFELTAQQESVKFAESRLAKEVIEWMTDGFSKTIDATDRRSHIERINVPFAFNVYTNKITCNLGTYDFEIKRCSNLTSPIEQTALARAIASAIQLNIVMKYPQDESGTSISINIDYNYSTECPTTTVTYVAPNGNYRAVEKW